MAGSIADLRREYARAALNETELHPDPIEQFRLWFAQVVEAEAHDPSAMVLATASADGRPSARVVLLKGVDADGFVFYTDYRSRKGRELEENPFAALVFYWPELERQVRVTGTVSRVSRAESEAYFRSRPRGSRLAAWASHQSAPLSSRAELEARLDEVTARVGAGIDGEVPLPPHWGGFRVTPDSIEFWQGRPNRLHDRFLYTLEPHGAWRIERLSP